MNKRIHVLAIGGTISSTSPDRTSCTVYAPALNCRDLLDSIPGIPGVTVTGEDILKIDSASLTPPLWLMLAKHITELFRKDVDGVVITHGTDTMEETAYFLNLTVRSPKPVVLTGAMRPASALSADGPLNLYQAIQAAASEKLISCGAAVVMNNTIVSAREVRKDNPFRPDAFLPKESGVLGYISDGSVEIIAKTAKLHTVQSPFDISGLDDLPKTGILYAYAGAEDALLDFFRHHAYEGVALACVGNGNLSKSWKHHIRELAKEGLIFVRCSRANGFVNHNGAIPDDELKTVSGGNLSAQKARILLMLALTQTHDPRQIQKFFDQF